MSCPAANIKKAAIIQSGDFANNSSLPPEHEISCQTIKFIGKTFGSITVRNIIVRFVISANFFFFRIILCELKTTFLTFEYLKNFFTYKMISTIEL